MGWERGILAAAPSGFRRQRLWLSAPDHTCVAAAVPCAQNQRAFQKQDNIFVGKKRALGSKKPGIRETRYYKSVGLGIKTPRTAIEGTYVDKKCPWTGAQCRRAPRLRTLCRQFSFTAPCPPPRRPPALAPHSSMPSAAGVAADADAPDQTLWRGRRDQSQSRRSPLRVAARLLVLGC